MTHPIVLELVGHFLMMSREFYSINQMAFECNGHVTIVLKEKDIVRLLEKDPNFLQPHGFVVVGGQRNAILKFFTFNEKKCVGCHMKKDKSNLTCQQTLKSYNYRKWEEDEWRYEDIDFRL